MILEELLILLWRCDLFKGSYVLEINAKEFMGEVIWYQGTDKKKFKK